MTRPQVRDPASGGGAGSGGAGPGGAGGIVAALAGAGTRLLFGVPGGGPNLDVVGAAAGAGLTFVLAHGETAATIMAATCADLTGSPGAVVVTRGPGLASAVNGIAHARLDRLPLVVIADSVPARDRDRISHQRLDQPALARPVAKAAVTASSGQAARDAVALALAPPAGPVVVTMDPGAAGIADPAGAPPAGAPPAGAPPAGAPPAGEAPPAGQVLAPLAAALRSSRRPAVLLGTGALAHTRAVRAALTGSGIPVLHTYRARGIVPDQADEAAGLVTGGTAEWPLLAAADLIIGLGVDPAEMIPAAWDYPAPTIVVTGDAAGPGEAARYFTGATELPAPVPAALGLLAALGHDHSWPPATGRTAKADVRARLLRAGQAGRGLLSPQDVVTTVRAHTPAQTVATVDAGAHMLVAMPLWEVDEPRRLLISSGLATMGYALPAAVAAALCVPDVPVVAFTGDGGLGMTLMEIETAVRFGLRVVVVVFNDSTLSLIRIKQRPAGHGGPEAVGYRPVSFAAAASALGAAGARVTDAAELASALAAALGRDGPTVIDAGVDPATYPAVMDLTRGEAGRRGTDPLGAAAAHHAHIR